MASIQSRKVTVVGAGFVGSTCAQLAAFKNLASEVVLIDVLEGRPQGIALDLNQSAAVEGFQARVIGTNDPADTADSDVVIMTAGRPRKPGMSRSDLLEVNGRIVATVAEYVRRLSPEAIVIVVTNPLDSMVSLMRHCLGFPARRVIGMAGVLDSSRFCWFIREETGAAVQDVNAMVLGAHGDSMVPMPNYCTVNGVQVADLVKADRMDAMAMAESILNDAQRLMPCACLMNGEFGFEGVYMGVPAILGSEGVQRIVEVPLTAEARAQLQKTAGAVQNDVEALRDLGLM